MQFPLPVVGLIVSNRGRWLQSSVNLKHEWSYSSTHPHFLTARHLSKRRDNFIITHYQTHHISSLSGLLKPWFSLACYTQYLFIAGPNNAVREASGALCSNDVVRSTASSPTVKILFLKYKEYLYCTCATGDLLQKGTQYSTLQLMPLQRMWWLLYSPVVYCQWQSKACL